MISRELIKVAIIGAGFCGLAVAWYLLEHKTQFPNLQIHLFDSKGIGKGASGIAAGLLHPFSGAHAKLNWKGREGFNESQMLLNIASQSIGQPVFAKKRGILRLALNAEQESDYRRCANTYTQEVKWLDSTSCQALVPGCALAGGILINEGMTIYSALYLQGLWKACEKLGAAFELRRINSLTELRDFDITVVTAGAEINHLSELSNFPITMVKGQVLEISWPQKINPLSYPLNSHVYIVMNESNTSCLVGSTYEKGYKEAKIDLEIAQKEILPKAFELFPPLEHGKILNCYAGMRAVTRNHRPIIHRLSSTQWILTGMGSKGLLYHALFAKELVKSIGNDHSFFNGNENL